MTNIADKLSEFAKNLATLEQMWESLKVEVDGKLVEMKKQLAEAQKDEAAKKTENKPSHSKSQAKEQSGNFPYAVGEVVKVAFPELFKRKLINAGDLAYLLSTKATKDFKMRGNSVLRLFTTEDDPGLFASGRRRYYKEIPLLQLGSKKYHLSNQFFPESREAVLKWIYARGLKKKDLIAIIEAAKAAK